MMAWTVTQVLTLSVVVGWAAAAALKEATPTKCGPCVALDMVWCYHDDTCYPHGSHEDALPFACPGTNNCAASDCDCKICDSKCQPSIPNAAECNGSTCTIDGQYCSPKVPGSSGNGFCCVGDTWVPGVCAIPNPLVSNTPSQIHLGLGRNPGEMTVSWVSSSITAAEVHYGVVGGQPTPSIALGDTRQLNISGIRNTHVATMVNLTEGDHYSYSIVGNPKAFAFAFRHAHQPDRVNKHIIFGDMGGAHAYSLCRGCTGSSSVCNASTCAGNTSVGLVAELDADMFLHLGDFAYNFDTDGGVLGDQFMDNIEQVAGRVPYMVSHGNHEDNSACLAHYIERFRGMPSNAVPPTFTSAAGEATNTLYYSWDAGLVHYIAISTELWFGVGDASVNTASLLKWLEADLAAANANRDNVPWVIAHGHRDIYCSTSDDSDCNAPGAAGTVRNDLEPLFYKYGVDLWINGHEHSYERTFPLYQGKSVASNVNPPSTIYIVTGAAGSPEMHEGFDNKQPSWSAFRSNTFGYSRMHVYNSSHLYWEQVQTDPTLFPGSDYGRVIDSVWIVQDKHGPFDPARVPTGTAFPIGDESRSRSQDHWEPLFKKFGVDDGSNRAMSAIIRDYKAKHGEAAFAKIEDKLLQYINSHEGSVSTYEDVRADGSSTGSWLRWKGL